MPQIIKKPKKIRNLLILHEKNPRYAPYSLGKFSFGYPKVKPWGENATLKIG
jgi:hypothetical protein